MDSSTGWCCCFVYSGHPLMREVHMDNFNQVNDAAGCHI